VQKVWFLINRLRSHFTASQCRQAGFSVVEIILAAAIFSMLATAMIGALVYGRASSDYAADRAQAHFLAEEGIEATRNIGDASFANLTAGNHGLTISGGQWAFSGTSDVDASGLYTRVVNVSVGTNRDTITSTVTWSGGGNSVVLTAELTNWPATLKSWSNTTVTYPASSGSTAAYKVATQGNYAYTVVDTTGVLNFYVTDLTTGTNVASLNYGGAGKPQAIAVSGNYAYIAASTDGGELVVINITTPTAPSVATTLDLTGTGNGQGIYVYGNYLYEVRASDATTGANEFNVIDISNPLAPVAVGGIDDNITMNDVYVNGNYAFVASSSTTQELMVFDVSSPKAPSLKTTISTPTASAALGVAGSGNTIYLGTGTTFNVITFNPTAGTLAQTGTLTGLNSTIEEVDVDITKQYVFVGTASTTTGLQIVSITTPSAPSILKSVTTANAVDGLAYSTTFDQVILATRSTTQEIGIGKRA